MIQLSHLCVFKVDDKLNEKFKKKLMSPKYVFGIMHGYGLYA